MLGGSLLGGGGGGGGGMLGGGGGGGGMLGGGGGGMLGGGGSQAAGPRLQLPSDAQAASTDASLAMEQSTSCIECISWSPDGQLAAICGWSEAVWSLAWQACRFVLLTCVCAQVHLVKVSGSGIQLAANHSTQIPQFSCCWRQVSICTAAHTVV